MKKLEQLFLAGLACALSSCAPITALGIKVLYRKADLPPSQIRTNLSYLPSDSSLDNRQKLDLYLPIGNDWPVIIFVHGGNWDEGDKQLRVGGADVYANIGRFYANHGIGVAVVNYRLQPKTDWRNQVEDVKTAVQWVGANIQAYGGQPDRLFLMGHSAGAYLACFTAFTYSQTGNGSIRGVISVSGAALDLTDQKTYDLGEDIRFYEKRFSGGDLTTPWKEAASPVNYVNEKAPPFLILYAGGETKGLQRQSECLKQALIKKGIENRLVVVPGESHSRMVLTLSREDKTSVPEVLKFIGKHP